MNGNSFQHYLEALHRDCASIEDGAVASYIPELLKADPAWFGIALITVDGYVYQVGDSRQGPRVSERRPPVRLAPPPLAAVPPQYYVAQGGSGVVVYEVGASAARDGVRAGSWFFPGSPLPGGGPEDRLALFGIPWDLADEAQVRLLAEDDAGNAADVAFVDRFFPRPPARDTIALDDAFLSKVVTEIRQQTPGLEDRGGLLENYLQINRDLRKRNAEELVALAPRTAGAFLWTDPFLPLRNAKVMSAFADQRTYVYQGKDVDAQTHLGFDLAAVARTPVPAANRGVVVAIENHLTTVEDITNFTKAGGGCGSCIPDIEAILKDIWLIKPVPEKPSAPRKLTNLQKIELIQDVIEKEIRPRLQSDGGDIELIDIDGNKVIIGLRAMCVGCLMGDVTVKGIETKLRELVSEDIIVETG